MRNLPNTWKYKIKKGDNWRMLLIIAILLLPIFILLECARRSWMDRLFLLLIFHILFRRLKIVFKPFFILGNIFILPGDKNQSWAILARNSTIYFLGVTLNKVTGARKSYIQLWKLHRFLDESYIRKLDKSYMDLKVTYESYV